LANWKFSNEGQNLFEEKLKSIGWSSLSDIQLADQIGLYRSVVTKLRSGQQQGQKKTLEIAMIALGESADKVKSEAFARKYFQEVKNSPQSLSDKRLESLDEEIEIQELAQIAVENPFQPLYLPVDKAEQFFSRERELREIFDLLNSGSGGVNLLGDRQMGKTSMLRRISQLAASELRDKWEPIYLSLHNIHSEADFYQAFCDELGVENCTGYALTRIMKSRRVLLLLDEVENLQGDDFTKAIRDVLRGFADQRLLRLVVASCTLLNQLFPDSNDKKSTSPLHHICPPVTLKPWQKPTVEKFIKTRLKSTGISFSEEEMEKLWLESQGHPQKLMKACFDLYRQYR
jgi:hypothetical protein